MLTTIQKWGNSHGVRLPKNILDKLFLQENDQVEIIAENSYLIIKKAVRKRRAIKSIAELFANYSGNYKCEEWDTGKPVGKEVW